MTKSIFWGTNVMVEGLEYVHYFDNCFYMCTQKNKQKNLKYEYFYISFQSIFSIFR